MLVRLVLNAWDYRCQPPHLAGLLFKKNFFFFIKVGFHHDGQAGHELLTSGDPPTSASQSARITGVSHRAWPTIILQHYLIPTQFS